MGQSAKLRNWPRQSWFRATLRLISYANLKWGRLKTKSWRRYLKRRGASNFQLTAVFLSVPLASVSRKEEGYHVPISPTFVWAELVGDWREITRSTLGGGRNQLKGVVKGVNPGDFFPLQVYSCRWEENINTDHKRNTIWGSGLNTSGSNHGIRRRLLWTQ
jgi:hypothetical protein